MGELFEIFRVFFKIGAMTFGGGYAMLPLLQADIARGRKWVAEEDIIDYYAMSQSLPGIVAVNVSMLIGHRKKGAPGLIAACAGMITPSIIIILVIAAFIKNFQSYRAIGHAFNGIRVAVAAMIIKTMLDMGGKSVTDWPRAVIFAASLAMFTFADVSPIIPVLFGAAAGVALMKRGRAR
jgi:chromate transporter